MHAKHHLWRNIIMYIKKKEYFQCFWACRKMPNYMQSTLYGETKRHYKQQQNHEFFFSTKLGSKTPKCMQITLFGVRKWHYQKRAFLLLYKELNAKKKKKSWKKLYMKKKTCHLSVFVLLTHQTAKTHKKKKQQKTSKNISFEYFWAC